MAKPNRRLSPLARRQKIAGQKPAMDTPVPHSADITDITGRQTGFRSIRYWTDLYFESLTENQIGAEAQCKKQ